MAGEGQSNKTEPATPRRREDARKKGKVAMSPEVGGATVLMVALIVLWLNGPQVWETLCGIYRTHLGGLSRVDMGLPEATRILTHALLSVLSMVAPVLIGMVIVSALAGCAQVGIHITPEAMELKLSQFDPVAGCKKLVSLRSLVTLGTNSLKVLVILAVGYLTVRSYLPRIAALYQATPHQMAGTMSRAVFDLSIRAAMLLMIVAAIDYAYQKWQYERDLRMTKQEVKDERKLLEGSPETKRRIRSAQLAMARRRMLNDVKKADVVVRNPTHYAVALQYDAETSPAPVVLAKGAGYLAERILTEARKHRIPEVHDAPVAQALYKAVEVGEQIPPKLYRAVARLLVHVYKLAKRAAPGGRRST